MRHETSISAVLQSQRRVPDVGRNILRPIAERAVSAKLISCRHMEWNRHDSSESKRSRSVATNERRHDMDLRGRAADEPGDVHDNDPLRAFVAANHHYRFHGAGARQHSARAHQHSGELRLTARVSGDIRERTIFWMPLGITSSRDRAPARMPLANSQLPTTFLKKITWLMRIKMGNLMAGSLVSESLAAVQARRRLQEP